MRMCLPGSGATPYLATMSHAPLRRMRHATQVAFATALPKARPFVTPWAAASLALLLGLAPAAAQNAPRPAQAAPVSLGQFDDWEAATATEGGNRICYVFTRPTKTEPAQQGRGSAVLSVTHRGPNRDQVAVAAGFRFADRAEFAMSVDRTTNLAFFTRDQAAFARDGQAAVQAFQRGAEAVTRTTGPRGAVADTWSLKGFSAAYRAIGQACAR